MTLLAPTDNIVLHSTGNALDAAKTGTYVETLTASVLYKLVGTFPGVVGKIHARFIWDGLGPWTLGFDPGVTWFGGVTPAFDTSTGAHVDIDFTSVDNGATWTAQLGSQVSSVVARPTDTIPNSGLAQVIDLTNVEIDETLTADTVHTFTNLQPGAELDLIVTPDGVGNHTPSFPANVNWFGAKPAGPLLGPAAYHFLVGHNLRLYGQKFDIAPAAPNAPTITGTTPTDTTIGISFVPSPITNGSTLTGYLFTVLSGSTVVFTSSPGAGATTATATGLTQTTNYTVSLVAVSAAGNSTAAQASVKTLATAPPSAPTIPTSVVASGTGRDGKALLTWSPSASGSPDHYVVNISLPGGSSTPSVVQSAVGGNSLGLTSFLYNTTAPTPFPLGSNLGTGRKLIIVTHDNDYTGTRTVAVGGTVGTGGSVAGGTAATRVGTGADDGGDAHVEIFEISTTAFAGTKPLVTYNRAAPGNVGPVEMEIYEVVNAGALDKVAVGTSTFPATAFPSGTTATLAQAIEFALAGWTFSNSPNTPTYGTFASLHDNDRGSTASLITASTAGVGDTATVASQDGIGMVATWKATGGGTAFSFSDTVLSTNPLEYLFTQLTNGTTYNYSITPWNSAGPGTAATGTVTPTAPTGGSTGGKAALRAAMGNQQTHKAWLQGLTTRYGTFSPAGPITWSWHYNTVVETDMSIALAEYSSPSDPIQVLRFGNDPSGSGAQWTISEINSAVHDGAIDSMANDLVTLSVSQGRRQIIRPLYEGADANWMPWSINRFGSVNTGTSVTAWTQAFARIVSRVNARFAAAGHSALAPQVDLCLNLGYGDGQDNAWNNGHSLWDKIVAALQALGVHIDYVDTDCYSNGPRGGDFLAKELPMIVACCVRWAAGQGGTGCQVAHGEHGIGDPQNSQGPHNWDAVVWINTFVDWWFSLPANTGGTASPTPGSLGHIEFFDLGDPQNVDWRSFSFISNPTSNPDGPRVGGALKLRIN